MAWADSQPVLFGAMVLLVGGQGLVSPSMAAVVSKRAQQDARGAALGLQQAAGALGRVVGPIAVGAVYASVSIAAAYVVAAVVAAAAFVVLFNVMLRPAPSKPAAPEPVTAHH